MRLRMTDSRERRLDNLCKATGQNTKSKAIDQAAAYYVKMAGGTTAVPTGTIAELLATAEAQGSLTVEEIAEILDTEELPITADIRWTIGAKDE